MSPSLSKLANNLSEIYSKSVEGVEKEKKIKSQCDFIGLKNNKLHHKCNMCKQNGWYPWVDYLKSFQIYMNFVMEILTNLLCY